jgi:thymidylate synthase (FAD)
VDESDTDFIVPPALEQLAKVKPEAWDHWRAHMQASVDLYVTLVEDLDSMYMDVEDRTERRKKARQAARSVLPNATETKIAITLNARALRHVIQMRASAAADVEIRRLAVELLHVSRRAAPLLFYDMRIVTLPDGTQAVESKHLKV